MDDEIRRLGPVIQNEPPREGAFRGLAFRTGQRRCAILAASFEQFAAPHEWRFVVKGGREHWLGVPRQVDEVLARLRVIAGISPYLFASRRAETGHLASVQKSPGRLKETTGIDLRMACGRPLAGTCKGPVPTLNDQLPELPERRAVNAGLDRRGSFR